MKKQYIHTQKTARYFMSKEIDEKVKQVVFVFHGYAQNADSFLTTVLPLATEETLLVSPEGLSKFYWKDFTAQAVSSWMTSLERELEIEDTLHYLSKVLMEIKMRLPAKGVSFHCFGFSQGAATASRFACNAYLNCVNLFLYGGSPAHDLVWNSLPKKLHFQLIYGDNDPLVSASQASKIAALIRSKKFAVETNVYAGKHKIEEEGLAFVKESLGN